MTAVYPAGSEGLEHVAEHIYHAMHRRNQALWDRSGVTIEFEALQSGVNNDEWKPVIALAAYVARTGESWADYSELWVPETELYGAYEDMQRYGKGVVVDKNPAVGM